MSGAERFFLPTGGSALEAYRAFRAWAERQAAARGRKLDPAWYRDGPEDLPEFYDERPSGPEGESSGGGAPPGHGQPPASPDAKPGGEYGLEN